MKTLYPLTTALALGISMPAFADLNEDVEMLKEQVRALQTKQGGNNLKFNVDYRVSLDSIKYKTAGGETYKNNDLLSNRLILNMGYAYNENLVFRGALSYNKAYGEQPNQPGPYAGFDWVVNENFDNDSNHVKVKEAYFLYLGDAFLGNEMLPWTFSLGRRPSTTGFLANNREGFEEAKSPLAHSINVEFDGLSLNVKTEKVIGLTGSAIKLCAGRGMSNARARFDSTGYDYSKDKADLDNIDFIGFIITPYNDGQYNLQTQIYYANHLIGMDAAAIMAAPMDPNSYALKEFGDLSNMTLSFEINGIGEFINEFLDDTRVFASYSMSKTHPKGDMAMLGSPDSETGSSYWVGVNVPGFIEGDSFGVEYNHGDKYWRSFTYGEDTLIGSKVAARGDAIEAYYNLPVIDEALTAQIRYTKIDYDYTGSNGFFGSYTGAPLDMSNPMAANAVKEAEDLRLIVRYKF
ncbi:DUF3373 family protein [Aestuariirhabdus litorea]|nr:DUF3373 family protein [Aestuariirhabdus litorea]